MLFRSDTRYRATCEMALALVRRAAVPLTDKARVALLGGLGKHYPETVRPALEVIGADNVAGDIDLALARALALVSESRTSPRA